MKNIITIVFIITIQIQNLFSQERGNQLLNIEGPKFTQNELVTLSSKYKIDVLDYEKFELSMVRFHDADDNGNLYILSILDSKIIVFDSLGNFKREMGRKGQGPKELMKPFSFSVKFDKIYIYELYRGLKIWDLDGNYIDFILFAEDNQHAIVKPFSNYFLVSYWEWDGTPIIGATNKQIDKKYNYSIFDLKLKKLFDINSLNINSLITFHYAANEMMAIDNIGNIYTPVNSYSYRINKYNNKGKLLISFGREYKALSYSKRVQEWYFNRFTKRLNKNSMRDVPWELKGNTPIVRHIMVDGNKYVWVVVGEWYADNESNYKMVSTVDIFSIDGDFLYSFKTDKITEQSFIKNNLLYAKPQGLLLRSKGEDSNINVYNIGYKFHLTNR